MACSTMMARSSGVRPRPTFDLRNARISAGLPESTSAIDVLHEMRAKRIHLAIVVDEHGGMEGIVTLEDLIEELVGEIHSEHGPPPSGQVTREPGGTFVVPGLAPIREINRETGLRLD